MRYYIPFIRPLDETGRHLGPEQPAERLGGVPFGLPANRWPTCADCGKSQSLLAQFQHHSDRLNLGREGRMLFVFQCAHDPGMCATWAAFSGANACVILEPEDLEDRATRIPADMPPTDNCVTIISWPARDDDISDSEEPAFFEEGTFLALGDAVWRKASMSTRLGSVPSWIQSVSEWPGSPWKFLGQLDSGYSFTEPPEPQPHWVSIDSEQFEGRSHWAQGPNFGDGGIAYLFSRETGDTIEACMFWQCG